MSIKKDITGRMVYTIDSQPVTHVVKEFRTFNNEVILRRIFDTHGILLEDRAYTSNIKAVKEDTFFSHYRLYSKEEESSLRHAIDQSQDHVFTIKYQLMYLDGENECLPVEIQP